MSARPFRLNDPTPADPRRHWETLDRAGRGACYDNNAAVANSAAQVAARDAASARFRAAFPGAKPDLPYGPHARNALDLYPSREAGAPCLVFIHGGYWQRGARELFACFAEGPCDAGWSVAMIGYNLAPEASLTQIVGEVGAALDWIGAHGSEHGLAGPVVLSGWSAGGHLAAMQLAHPVVSAGLAISGVYDLAPIRETYLDEKLRLTETEIETLSPLRLPVMHKPLCIAYGSRELPTLVHDGRNLHGLRAAAHAPGSLLPVPGREHFSVLDELRRPDGILVRAAQALVTG